MAHFRVFRIFHMPSASYGTCLLILKTALNDWLESFPYLFTLLNLIKLNFSTLKVFIVTYKMNVCITPNYATMQSLTDRLDSPRETLPSWHFWKMAELQRAICGPFSCTRGCGCRVPCLPAPQHSTDSRKTSARLQDRSSVPFLFIALKYRF